MKRIVSILLAMPLLASACGGTHEGENQLQQAAAGPSNSPTGSGQCDNAAMSYALRRDVSASFVVGKRSTARSIAEWQERFGLGTIRIPVSEFRARISTLAIDYCVFKGSFPIVHHPEGQPPPRSFPYLVVLVPTGEPPQEFETVQVLPVMPG